MHLSATRRARLGMVMVVVALLTVACRGAATPAPSWPAGSLVVTAKNRQFDTKELQFKAESQVILVLINEDADAHNIVIRTRSGFDGDLLFRFDPVSSTSIVLTMGPIPKGSYFFLCEVHPTMSGTVFAY